MRAGSDCLSRSPSFAGPFIFSWILICALSLLSAASAVVIGIMHDLDPSRGLDTGSAATLAR